MQNNDPRFHSRHAMILTIILFEEIPHGRIINLSHEDDMAALGLDFVRVDVLGFLANEEDEFGEFGREENKADYHDVSTKWRVR
jgi:hypothetical protein